MSLGSSVLSVSPMTTSSCFFFEDNSAISDSLSEVVPVSVSVWSGSVRLGCANRALKRCSVGSEASEASGTVLKLSSVVVVSGVCLE